MTDPDLVIVGSGAGAAPLALTVARAGFSVLILEKGADYDDAQYRSDEASLADGFLYPTQQEVRTLVTKANPQGIAHPLGWSANCVGGGTVHMGGFMYRFGPEDFRSVTEFGAHWEAVDWPVGYEDFEPWYELAEDELGIAGNAATELGANARRKPYCMPALQEHPSIEKLDGALQQLRWRSMTTPRAVNSIARSTQSACIYCDACAGYGCRVGAKNSVQRSILRRALATGRVTLLPNTRVIALRSEAERVTHVHYVNAAGANEELRVRYVSLSATAIESARLLLLSASALHPNGIGNAHAQVGRHLQFHAVTMGTARFPIAGSEKVSSLPFLGRTVTEHLNLSERSFEDVPLIGKGGLLRFDMHTHKPLQSYRIAQALSSTALYGDTLRKEMSRQRHRTEMISFEAFHDYFPNTGTRMDLDSLRTDQFGLPVARIQLEVPRHQQAVGKYLAQKAKTLFDEMGANDLVLESVGGVVSHLAQGTCRFGLSPENSVLNSDCRVHDMQNLFVVDGGFMPTSGSAPPTLTILANSFRVGDLLVRKYL
jgi:choline dehydrogenase-like flavoprotein